MERELDQLQPNRQQTYRQTQNRKGLVRLEIQVSLETKKRFDEMVTMVANELEEPWDIRRRLAKARGLVFDEMTKGTIHHFDRLSQKIIALEEQLSLTSPTLSINADNTSNQKINTKVESLPDDPMLLKQNLSKIYKLAVRAQLDANKYKNESERYLELYTLSQNSEQ